MFAASFCDDKFYIGFSFFALFFCRSLSASPSHRRCPCCFFHMLPDCLLVPITCHYIRSYLSSDIPFVRTIPLACHHIQYSTRDYGCSMFFSAYACGGCECKTNYVYMQSVIYASGKRESKKQEREKKQTNTRSRHI